MRRLRYLITGVLLLVAYRGALLLSGVAGHEFSSIVGGDVPQPLAFLFALLGLTLFGAAAEWVVDRLARLR